MLRHYLRFPYLLLDPDANGSATGGSSPSDGGEGAEIQNNGAEPVTEPTAEESADAAFEAAAATAIDTVTKSVTPADKADATEKQGENKSLNPTDGEKNADGTPKTTVETPEAKAEREAAVALTASEAAKTEKKIDKAGDEALPFNTHPRWKEVIAERDTSRTELQQFRQQYETVKPLADAHQGVVDYLAKAGVDAKAYQETIAWRALANTDPEKALAAILPVVASLQALAGKGIAPDLQQEVRDGTLTEQRAQEITQFRAQQTRGQAVQQQTAEQQRAAVVQQMEHSVNAWFSTKKTSDASFENKVTLVNGVFGTLCNATPPQSPAEVTALLEKAYVQVNESLNKFTPAPKAIKPPLKSNHSRPTPKDPVDLDEYAAQLVENVMNQA